jgi:hypothetical protein
MLRIIKDYIIEQVVRNEYLLPERVHNKFVGIWFAARICLKRSETDKFRDLQGGGGHGTEQWDLLIYNFLQGEDLIYKNGKTDALWNTMHQ